MRCDALFGLLLAIAGLAGPTHATPVNTAHVEADLVAETRPSIPGQAFHAAIVTGSQLAGALTACETGTSTGVER